jgi:hypothetical protein
VYLYNLILRLAELREIVDSDFGEPSSDPLVSATSVERTTRGTS